MEIERFRPDDDRDRAAWSRPAPLLEEEYGEDTINLREVLSVLRRQMWLVLAVVVATLGVTAYVVLSQPPQYRAVALLRVADSRGALTGGMDGGIVDRITGSREDPILSQLEIMRSPVVLGEVAAREGLRARLVSGKRVIPIEGVVVETPEFETDTVGVRFERDQVIATRAGETVTAGYGEPIRIGTVQFTVPAHPGEETGRVVVRPIQSAMDELNRNLRARVRDRTDVVEVDYTHPDRIRAQRVVNTAIEVFQLQNVTTAQQQSRRRRLFIEAQLESVDSMLIAMQADLSRFRTREQVLSSRDQFAAQQQGLFQLDMRREEMQADRRMYQSLLNNLARPTHARAQTLRTLVSAPGIAENRVIAQLYEQLVAYETEREQLVGGGLGATQNHPDVQRLDVLIGTTEEKLVDAARSHLESVDARLTALNDLRARSASSIEQLPASEAEEVRLVQQVETTRRMGDQLREELQRARIAEAVEAGQVEIVHPALLPLEPVGTNRGLKLGLGLMLGFMLGAGGAFLREHLNTSIRRQEDLEQTLQVASLAVIPRIANGSLASKLRLPASSNGAVAVTTAAGRELVTVSDSRSPTAEAFRMLRTNLLFSDGGDTIKVLAVTSATPGEGKTTTAANLAATYAQQGMSVLLVDCDLRKARVHKMFDLSLAPGLTELLAGTNTSAEAIRPSGLENLSVLTAGLLPNNPSELLGGPRMHRGLQKLRDSFDLVVLDTPPLMAASDAAILGSRCDGVVIVVRAGRVDRGAVRFAMQQLRAVRAPVLGAVLNDPDAELPKYGGYYYYEYGEKAGQG